MRRLQGQLGATEGRHEMPSLPDRKLFVDDINPIPNTRWNHGIVEIEGRGMDVMEAAVM
jgi:hypothetical protein